MQATSRGWLSVVVVVALVLLADFQRNSLVAAIDHGSYSPNDFYRMVEDVTKGVDYYKVLGDVDESAQAGDIRKAFKKASLIWYVVCYLYVSVGWLPTCCFGQASRQESRTGGLCEVRTDHFCL